VEFQERSGLLISFNVVVVVIVLRGNIVAGSCSQAIPAIMRGRNVIGLASTGSGKTFAFLLPMIMHIMDQREIERGEGPIALVLCPTREVALQTHSVVKRFFRPQGCQSLAVVGGESSWEQRKALKQPREALVATPGRLIDMLKAKATNLRRVTFVALDEADKMLDVGFEPAIHTILNAVRPDRQIVLFSATFKPSSRLRRLVDQLVMKPLKITVNHTKSSSRSCTKQRVVVLSGHHEGTKLDWLDDFLQETFSSSLSAKVLIFVAEQEKCDRYADIVRRAYAKEGALGLHGGLTQSERTLALRHFKNSIVRVLVATDVAARGLHIKDLSHVVCFDPSRDRDTHQHRIGRTARLGGVQGVAISLLFENNRRFASILAETLISSHQNVPSKVWHIAMQDARFRKIYRNGPPSYPEEEAGAKQLEPLTYGLFVKGSTQPSTNQNDNVSQSTAKEPITSKQVLCREERNALAYTVSQQFKQDAAKTIIAHIEKKSRTLNGE